MATPGAKEVALELNSLSKSGSMAGVACRHARWKKPAFINEVLRFKSNMDSGMFQPATDGCGGCFAAGAEWYAELNTICDRAPP